MSTPHLADGAPVSPAMQVQAQLHIYAGIWLLTSYRDICCSMSVMGLLLSDREAAPRMRRVPQRGWGTSRSRPVVVSMPCATPPHSSHQGAGCTCVVLSTETQERGQSHVSCTC